MSAAVNLIRSQIFFFELFVIHYYIFVCLLTLPFLWRSACYRSYTRIRWSICSWKKDNFSSQWFWRRWGYKWRWHGGWHSRASSTLDRPWTRSESFPVIIPPPTEPPRSTCAASCHPTTLISKNRDLRDLEKKTVSLTSTLKRMRMEGSFTPQSV